MRAPTNTFGRENRRSRPTKGIDDDLAATCAILDGVRHHHGRLDGRMRLQIVKTLGPERIHPGVVPNIRARSTVAPEFDVVEMRLVAHPEYPDEFVLAAIERTLTGVGFYPYREIEDRSINRVAGFIQFSKMTPVHADVVNGTLAGKGGRRCQARL